MADLWTPLTAEEGGASPFGFSSVTAETDNTFTISGDAYHSSSHSYRAYFGGTAGSNWCFGNRGFTESRNVWLRFYFQFNDTVDLTPWPFTLQDGSGTVCYLQSTNSGGNISFNRYYRFTDAGSGYTSVASGTITRNVWHSIELWWKSATAPGANDGETWIKYDGTELCNLSGLDSDTLLPDNVRAGNLSSSVLASGSIIYIDDLEGKDAVPSGTLLVPTDQYFRRRRAA